MQYMGGKARISREIVGILESVRISEQQYYEPFIGACSIFSSMSCPKIGSDVHQDLIMLWNAVQDGWIPPDTVSEEEYELAKSAPSSALRGFIGFGCSFGGKWFGGYARGYKGRNYASNARNSILKKSSGLNHSGCYIIQCSFEDLSPEASLIYCDPPYASTTKYNGTDHFNHQRFWNVIRDWSINNIVIVSEFDAPPDFTCIATLSKRVDMRYSETSKNRPEEKLFCFDNMWNLPHVLRNLPQPQGVDKALSPLYTSLRDV